MRRAIFFLFILLSFYVATIQYYQIPLFFSLTGLLLAIGMRGLSFYFRRHIKAESFEKSIVGEQGGDLSWNFQLLYTGRLPFRHFRLPLWFQYCGDPRRRRKTLSGILENEDGKVRCFLRAPYCGMLYLETKRLLVYDYLGLFPGRIPFSHTVTVAVLPPRQHLAVEFSSPRWSENISGHDQPLPRGADDRHEIRQLHEYREGDSCRHIHWNLSARTDRLWIREYERERDVSIRLLLEINSIHERDSKRMDAFYRLLSAMVLGMLRKIPLVKIYWYTRQSARPVEWIVTEEGQCQDMLLALYRTDSAGRPGSSSPEFIIPEDSDSFFRLDTSLSWRLGNRLIYQFSPQALTREIANQVFNL